VQTLIRSDERSRAVWIVSPWIAALEAV